VKHWGALALVVLSACRGTLSDEELLRMANAAAAAREGGMAAQDSAAEASDRIPVRLDDSGAVRHTKALDGRFDAALALSAKSEWDLAAADLVISHAGAGPADGARVGRGCRRPIFTPPPRAPPAAHWPG
jgi:fructose-1,6-bisphosphatase/inositol monophosphatase family enzyme